MKKPPEAKLVLLGEDHSGRDEMNLAGNPFALLQAASKSGQTFIRNEWERTLPNGKIVTAKWEVSGHAELGLPGPSEELLFLVLLQLTKEQSSGSEWNQIVHFSRFDILQRLGWPDTKQYYQMLHDAFSRLQSVSIQADHSFWDARAKAPFARVGFALLDNFSISNEPLGQKSQDTLPLSSFKWNDVIYNSFSAGNVRSMALDFALSLKHPTSIRLFRFLDMMRGATNPPRREFSIGLFKLCDRLGMTSYKYASKIKEKLKSSINELVTRGYLESVRYEKSKDGVELAIFRFGEIKAEIGQDGTEKGSKPTTPPKAPKTRQKPQQLALLEEVPPTDVRADALRCYEIFQTLPESEQTELLEIARRDVSPIWHDRVGQPESPMSLGLWQLVADRYGERLK
jgi:hypothetical protein